MFCLDCDYPLKGLGHARCPECGRGFDPGDRSTFATDPHLGPAKRSVFTARLLLLPPTMLWMFYWCWSMRTWDVSAGIILDMLALLLFASLFGGAPLMFLIWIGSRARQYLVGVFLSIAIPICAAQGLALYEEHWFVSQCQSNPAQFHRNGTTLYHDRWWPNGNSFLGYDTTTGTLFGGD